MKAWDYIVRHNWLYAPALIISIVFGMVVGMGIAAILIKFIARPLIDWAMN